uniref:Uncharacterized protein n=1 Tax=Cannabis sativa TaxID=3483 RepID=A0A803P4F4_CANSA
MSIKFATVAGIDNPLGDQRVASECCNTLLTFAKKTSPIVKIVKEMKKTSSVVLATGGIRKTSSIVKTYEETKKASSTVNIVEGTMKTSMAMTNEEMETTPMITSRSTQDGNTSPSS